MHVGFNYQNRLPTFLQTFRNKPHPKPRSESPGTDVSMLIHRAAGKSGVTVEKSGKYGLSGAETRTIRGCLTGVFGLKSGVSENSYNMVL